LKKFFPKSRMRISAGMRKFADQVTVISMTHLPRFTPLLWRCREGVRVAFYRCAFLRFFTGRFVTGWTRDSNWAAPDATAELILLRLRVWRLVDAHTRSS